MDDLLLTGRQGLDDMLDARQLFGSEFGQDEVTLNGIGRFVEIFRGMFHRQENFGTIAVFQNAVAKAGQQVGFDMIRFTQECPSFPQMQEKVMHDVFEQIPVADEAPAIVEKGPVVVPQQALEGNRIAFPELLPKYRILFQRKMGYGAKANVPFFFVGKNPPGARGII